MIMYYFSIPCLLKIIFASLIFTDLLTPTASKQFHPSYPIPQTTPPITSPHPPTHAHHSRAQSPPPNPAPMQHKKTIVSPPSLILDHPPHRHFLLANGSTTVYLISVPVLCTKDVPELVVLLQTPAMDHIHNYFSTVFTPRARARA